MDNIIVAEGGGFVVSDGYIVTNAHLLVEAESITVLALESGAEYVARLHDELRSDRNLALLRVTGLGLPPLNLSEQGIEVGRGVETLQFTGETDVRGYCRFHWIVSECSCHTRSRIITRVFSSITPSFPLSSFGMPLFNECGDVIGMNVPDPTNEPWPYQNLVNPSGSVSSLMNREITATLTASNVSPLQIVEEECLSAVERAERERANVEERMRALEQATQDSLNRERTARLTAEEAARTSQEEAEAARAALLESEQEQAIADSLHQAQTDSLQDAAKDSLVQMESFADSVQTALQDSLKAESTQFTSRLQETIYAAIGTLVVLLVGWFLYARKKKAQVSNASARAHSAERDAEAARQVAEKAPVPAPFKCVLDGKDNSGRTYVVNISELALGYDTGVVLGRSPADAEYLVDHNEVSREHVRLIQDSGRLYVEDLDTLNGTQVNDQPLSPGSPVEVNNDDRIAIGPVVFKIRLITVS